MPAGDRFDARVQSMTGHDSVFRGFLDESSARRGPGWQEYLVCTALIPSDGCEQAREQLRPLLLPGQIKLHWTAERERRRRDIVAEIAKLEPMNIVVSDLDAEQKRTERHRRKCLETLYHELVRMEVFDVTFECRSAVEDRRDRAHIVALQGQGLDRRLRISHLRGGDEPLLWIADAVLGAINSAHLGERRHLEVLRETLLIEARTPDSRGEPENERP